MSYRAKVVLGGVEGLHARPAAVVCAGLGRVDAEIRFIMGPVEVDGKSICELMMLAMTPGTTFEVTCEGPEAEEALRVLQHLFTEHEYFPGSVFEVIES